MGSEAKFFCLRPLDSEAQIWLIKRLLDSQISRSGDGSQFLEKRVCIEPVPLHVVSHNLYIERSRQSNIQYLTHHLGRQEGECHACKLFWKCQSKLVSVVVRGRVIGGKSHKNIGVR